MDLYGNQNVVIHYQPTTHVSIMVFHTTFFSLNFTKKRRGVQEKNPPWAYLLLKNARTLFFCSSWNCFSCRSKFFWFLVPGWRVKKKKKKETRSYKRHIGLHFSFFTPPTQCFVVKRINNRSRAFPFFFALFFLFYKKKENLFLPSI